MLLGSVERKLKSYPEEKKAKATYKQYADLWFAENLTKITVSPYII